MAHRHHQDDLSGMLLKQALEEHGEKWEYVDISARLDGPATHPKDPRSDGDPLWPWLWAGKNDALSPEEMREKALDRLKKLELANPFAFQSLYQQRPVARGGDVFRVEKLSIVRAAPAKRIASVRYWDKAGTEGAGKRTAGVKMSKLENGQFLVESCISGQWSALRREEVIKATTINEDGTNTTIWCEQEPGSGGKESAEATVRNLAGFSIHMERPTGDKVTRADGFSAQVEGGNVLLLEGDWNTAYIEELRHFPFGTFSDKVDASSGAFNKLANTSSFSIEDAINLRL